MTARRRSRWGRRLGIGVLVLMLLLVAGWWFSKPYVEAEIIERIQAAAKRRGWQARLTTVEWNRGDTVHLPAVEFTRDRSLGVMLQDVDVTLSMHRLLRGDVQIIAMDLGVVHAFAGLDALRAAGQATGEAQPTDAIGSLRPDFLAPGVQPGINHLFVHLHDAAGHQARLDVRSPDLQLDATQLSAALTGALQIKLPGDLIATRRPVQVKAILARGDQQIDVTVQGDQALFERTVEPHGTVRIGGARLRRRAGALTAEASAVELRLGPKAAPALRLEANRARLQPDGAVVFAEGVAQAGEAPRTAIAHARALIAAIRPASQTKASRTEPGQAKSGETKPGETEPGVAPGVEEEVQQKRILKLEEFTLRVEPEIDLMQAARVETDGTDLRFDGRVGGGTLSGRWRPGAVSLKAQDVRWNGSLRGHLLGGRFTGEAHLQRSPLRLTINAKVADGHVEHPALAPEPIRGIAAGFDGTITVEKGRVGVDSARVRVGAAEATASLTISGLPADPLTLRDGWPKGLKPLIDLRLTGDPIRCQQAIDALPSALLGPLQAVELSGFFRPQVRLRLPFTDPTGVRLETKGISKGGCDVTKLTFRPQARSAVDVAAPLDDVLWLDADFTMPVREGVSAGKTITVGPGTPDYVRLEDMPAYVGGAAYLSEEMGFYTGTGISIPLIAKALGTNLTKGRFAYGGSTVTQQLVKNLFLTRQKTLARKFQEALISARIARAISKDRVLELYLNCIEFGPDLYGIGPAARHYFQKDARALTPMEAVFLAMLKPAPRRGRWYVRQGRTPRMPYWDQRSRLLLERLEARHLVPAGTADAAAPYVLKWAGGKYTGAIRHIPIAPNHDNSPH